MRIDVENEVGRLRQVLVHRPGDEIVRMTQHDLDRMLFDDILAPTEAMREHEMMSEIMAVAGAQVFELAELLVAALQAAPADEVAELLDQCCRLTGVHSLAEVMRDWDAPRLARALICGIYWNEIDPGHASLARIRALLETREAMALRPLPNLMFLRDPCISVYDRVVVGRMATPARAREPLLVAFALRHAPVTAASLSFANQTGLDESFHSVEGGDVLVLSPELMMIGCSERTNAQTLEELVTEALFPDHPRLQRVYAVMMPRARSVMHLDTILTQIDRKLFLGHEPLVAAGEGQAGLPVARIARGKAPELVHKATVLDVLREEMGSDVGLVPCGGHDRLHQEREQWTDGANAVAVGPGQIMLYARNTRTITALAEQGFEEVRLSVMQSRELWTEQVASAVARGRTVFTFSGSELSRARGGGRCLTMPLWRDHIHDADG